MEELTMTDNFADNCKTNTTNLNLDDEDSVRNPVKNDKANRRHYRQLYKKDWEENPLFKGN